VGLISLLEYGVLACYRIAYFCTYELPPDAWWRDSNKVLRTEVWH